MDEPKHPPSFQFYPRDFLSSRAVCLMTPEARGGYITLLCHAWMCDEPGVLEDDDSMLAALSGLGDRWPACAASIRRAFRCTSREGRKVMLQERMQAERKAQSERFSLASLGGLTAASNMSGEQRIARAKAGADARWRANRMLTDAKGMLTPASASASASAVESLPASPAARLPLKPSRKRPKPHQLTHAEIAAEFNLPLARVQANAAKIAAKGIYRDVYRTLLNWCHSDVAQGFASEPANTDNEFNPINGHVQDFNADPNEAIRRARAKVIP